MKVTFEIEIDDSLVEQLDYYQNFGELHSPKAGCKKCIFRPMCNFWVDGIGERLPYNSRDCKFPCWAKKADKYSGTNRKVFVLKHETSQQ